MIESKKVFRYEIKCAGVGCPLADICGHYSVPLEQARNFIRAPYIRKNGKFVKCDQIRPCGQGS